MSAPDVEDGFLTPKARLVYDLLHAAAEKGAPCPTNLEITLATGDRAISQAARHVSILERLGLITVTRYQAGRVVTVVATNRRTAEPKGAKSIHHAAKPCGGLKADYSPRATRPDKAGPPPAAKPGKPIATLVVDNTALPPSRASVRPAAAPPSPYFAAPGAPSPATKALLAAIAQGTCRWPLGDPKEEGFRFCSEPPTRGRPYCAHHYAKSWRRPRAKE